MKRWLQRPNLKRQGQIKETQSTDFSRVLLDDGGGGGGGGGARMVGGGGGDGLRQTDTKVSFPNAKMMDKHDPVAADEKEDAPAPPLKVDGQVCFIQQSPYRIHKLAATGQLKAFTKLFTEQPNKLKVKDLKGKLPIHYAASNNRTNIIDFIAENSNDLDGRDGDGNTALHLAVLSNEPRAVQCLLSHGADPNLPNDRAMAPLHLAAETNKHEVVKALCSDTRTDVDIAGEAGLVPLHYTCYHDSREAAIILLQHDAKICKPCNIGMYPMHLAAQSGASKVLEALIETATLRYGQKNEHYLCFKTQEKSTPLHAAINGGMIEIVRICLRSGIKITMQMEDGSTPVHMASSQGLIDVLKLMLDMQPELKWEAISATDTHGNTPLHKAALYDRVDIINYLIDEGAEMNSLNVDDETPVLLAASKKAWNAVHALIAKHVSIDFKDKENRNLLHLIIQNGGRPDQCNLHICCKGLKQLLDEADNHGCTPLHYASKHGMISTIRDLLDLGAVLDAKNNQKQSPLHFAAQYGRYNTCLKLLESPSAGPKAINEMDGNGHSPLHSAASGGHVKVVRLLLARGATCTRDIAGNTALHLAAQNGYTQTMRLLLNTNSHLLGSRNKVGDTAIHLAAEAGCAQAVTLLMTIGASFVQNNAGLTFLDLAIRSDHKDVCIAIISHDRWEDVVSLGSRLYGCPVVGFIKYMPEVCQMVLDRCRVTVGSPKLPDFHYVYRFNYLDASVGNRKWMIEQKLYNPLHTLSCMVKYNRVECLSHPVCIAYLNMKWKAYGMWLHIINLSVYVIFLASLTTFVSIYDFGKAPYELNQGDQTTVQANTSVVDGFVAATTEREEEPPDDTMKMTSGQTLLTAIIMAFAVLNCVKEVAQMVQQKLKYLSDASNLLEWILYISTMVFIAPFMAGFSTPLQWQFGAVAVFLAWYNLLLFLRRFDFFGIYVVMFLEILKTLLSVMVVFSVLIVAFGMAFYILLCQEETAVGHHLPWLSITSTMVMMMGSVEYIDNWVLPYLDARHSYPILSFIMLLTFILFMPILLINLMIGLAVGDIEAIQRDARLKRLAMQVEIHTDWERKLPVRLLECVDKVEYKHYPNCRNHLWNKLWRKMNEGRGLYDIGAERGQSSGAMMETENQAYIYHELAKHKKRLKNISCDLTKQHDLLRLIIQKMEIHTEADDVDDENEQDKQAGDGGAGGGGGGGDCLHAIGWSSPALRNSLLKQASVVSAFKRTT